MYSVEMFTYVRAAKIHIKSEILDINAPRIGARGRSGDNIEGRSAGKASKMGNYEG